MDIIILFINGYPVYHSEDIKDIAKYLFNEFGEIKSVSYGWHSQEFIDIFRNSGDINKNIEWHSGIYWLIGDKFYNSNGEEFDAFALDGFNYLYELGGCNGCSRELLEGRLEEYCIKNNIK